MLCDLKTFHVADIGFADDIGYYDKSDSYKHKASQIQFDNPDLEKFPTFKDIKWQRVDLIPGDGMFITSVVLDDVAYVMIHNFTNSSLMVAVDIAI